jgi:hypothetical protein
MGILINLEIPHDRYAEIEEYCLNKAISIPAYFLALHELNTIHGILASYEKSERIQDFHRKFDALKKTESVTPEQNREDESIKNLQQLIDSEENKKTRKKKLIQ